MQKVVRVIRRFVADEQGLETVEYVILAAFMLITVIVGIGAFMAALQGKFDEIGTAVSDLP